MTEHDQTYEQLEPYVVTPFYPHRSVQIRLKAPEGERLAWVDRDWLRSALEKVSSDTSWGYVAEPSDSDEDCEEQTDDLTINQAQEDGSLQLTDGVGTADWPSEIRAAILAELAD
jgi:hypothetical protein